MRCLERFFRFHILQKVDRLLLRPIRLRQIAPITLHRDYAQILAVRRPPPAPTVILVVSPSPTSSSIPRRPTMLLIFAPLTPLMRTLPSHLILTSAGPTPAHHVDIEVLLLSPILRLVLKHLGVVVNPRRLTHVTIRVFMELGVLVALLLIISLALAFMLHIVVFGGLALSQQLTLVVMRLIVELVAPSLVDLVLAVEILVFVVALVKVSMGGLLVSPILLSGLVHALVLVAVACRVM